ncbi:hypothetical protein [Gallid alphaherpesvirus 2]|uniref:Uncharacterized protein n=1 Tax=Gallid alphaherpesvirus 2 TaxID=10390 RepID=A7KQ66_9ALPH|nr:hypothetical protein MDV072.4 [Gallid alphaherpesvirus 2]ACF49631.1 hypothetical protein MDV072.4 [synthetic construct]ACF94919.1 hypothetical protein MDV072.4 [Gallid alphaherpesvirus 2]AFM74640.1 hypothetical protein [Gallid alphaherpesvirus 2]AFM74828.1 hypothetical protein [Gallid alphaherpesvirus 2]
MHSGETDVIYVFGSLGSKFSLARIQPYLSSTGWSISECFGGGGSSIRKSIFEISDVLVFELCGLSTVAAESYINISASMTSIFSNAPAYTAPIPICVQVFVSTSSSQNVVR